MSVVIVCGGRDYTDFDTMFATLDRLRHEANIDLVVHGGARGADYGAFLWAVRRSVQFASEPVSKAEWKERGKAAGPIRNRRMLHKYAPDLVVAFPGHAGTADMVKQAKKANVMVAIVSPEGVVTYV